MNSWRLKLKIRGVRGSVPTPCAQNLNFGGNTPCVEIRLPGDDLLILDAGTGSGSLVLIFSQSEPSGAAYTCFSRTFIGTTFTGCPSSLRYLTAPALRFIPASSGAPWRMRLRHLAGIQSTYERVKRRSELQELSGEMS